MNRLSSLQIVAFIFAASTLLVAGCGSGSQSDGQTAGDSIAATAPHTDVLMTSLAGSEQTRVGELEPVTQRRGYDNQPAFTPDGKHLLWTSIRGEQSDVYRRPLDGGSDATTRRTKTRQSEYSPTPRPDGGLSVVRVEDDGRQRLWHYTMSGKPVEPIFAEADSVGYHAWLDADRVALFVLGFPPTLHVRSVSTGRDTVVASSIGRSLQSVPGRRAVSFVHVRQDSTTAIHLLDGEGATLRRRTLTNSPGDGRGDSHAWTPGGTLLMTDGGSLWAWGNAGEGWTPVASFGERTFTRLAVSPSGEHLALVEEK